MGFLCATPGTHSMSWSFTLTQEAQWIPKFAVVGYLDGLPMEYYDSTHERVVSRRHWRPDPAPAENEEEKKGAAEHTYISMFEKLQLAKKHFNHSGGLHTYQRQAGCELSDDGTQLFHARDAYDGQDLLQYNMDHLRWDPLVPELKNDEALMHSDDIEQNNTYQPLCIQVLKSYLEQEKDRPVMRVKPRVQVFQKTSALSGGTEVTCLATGFYPRALELTLLRDRRPVPEQELTGGEVLPNGDGTYQLRKSLALSKEEEERRERHRYTCRVQHSGLDNMLEVAREPEPDLDTGLIAGVVIGVLIVALVLPVAACVLWRKKGRGERGREYTEAQGRDQSGPSSNSSG
uniref:Ig-like domain-containing protein n=1 Tax=Lepisosteus oculatus TaxID=7918 RepID=W5LWA2_LEPOC